MTTILAGILLMLPAAGEVGEPIAAHASASFGDFNAYWIAGKLFTQQRNNYDPGEVAELNRQHELPNLCVIWYPPWIYPLLGTFSLLPFETAGVLWMGMNALLALVCARAIGRLFGLSDVGSWILGLTYLPVGICLGFSQLGILVLTGVVGFVAFRERGRPFWAGSCLALATLKPHIVGLVWIVLLLSGPWKDRFKSLFGLGLTLGLSTLLASIWHPELLGNYLTAIAHPPETPPTGYYSATLGMWLRMELGLLDHVWVQFVPFVLGAMSFALYLWRFHKRHPLPKQVGIALLISGLVMPYGWHYDQVTLLPIYLWLCAAVAEGSHAWPHRRVLLAGLVLFEIGQLAMLSTSRLVLVQDNERWYVIWPLLLAGLAIHHGLRHRKTQPLRAQHKSFTPATAH